VCVVWLAPGIERLIPVSATSLAGSSADPPSPCRLSAESARALLCVLGSVLDDLAARENTHDE
jgi:hypothetical protein